MNRLIPIHARLSATDGQTMTEYAVLLAAIALVVIVAAIAFGNALSGVWQQVSNTLPGG